MGHAPEELNTRIAGLRYRSAWRRYILDLKFIVESQDVHISKSRKHKATCRATRRHVLLEGRCHLS